MVRAVKIISLCLLSLFSLIPCYSQKAKVVGIEEGLSNNTVTSIYKDQNGFMWFGTIDGLDRYDGYSFKIFKNNYYDQASLPSDIILSINSDKAGNIWAGTRLGVGIQNIKTLKFSRLLVKDASGVKTFRNYVYCIRRDKKGNMYVGTETDGLLLAPDGSKVSSQIPLITPQGKIYSYQVNDIAVDDDRQVWLAIKDFGLCKFDTQTGTVMVVFKNLPLVTCLAAYKNDKIYLGTRDGVLAYSPHKGIAEKVDLGAFNNCNVIGFLIDKSDKLWITTYGQGILKLNISAIPQAVSQIDFGVLSSNVINCVYEDDFSKKWIGTIEGGINIIDDKTIQFKSYRHDPVQPNSLVHDFVYSFCEDQYKDIWIGTDGGGISIWKRKERLFKNIVFKPTRELGNYQNNVTSIIKDNQQRMWFSTFGSGIFRYNSQANSFQQIPIKKSAKAAEVWKLYKDHHGIIWATCFPAGADTSVLYRFEPKQGCFVAAPFSIKQELLSITSDNADNLWIGTYQGVIHADRVKGIDKVINFNYEVRSLLFSKTGTLWIGTYGRGIFSYNPVSGALRNYSELNGLCNNKVLNIEEDDKGDLWMSTYHGISKLDPKKGSFESYYAADGLQSNQFYFNASAHLSSGELMFGGLRGFNIFNPDSIHRFYDFPRLAITGIRIANSEVDASSPFVKGNPDFYHIDHLKLPYNKAMFSIDFVALQYSLAEKIQYAYMLEGRDKTWNYILNQHSLNYSQLNEGDYVLKIKCTNPSGIWNDREKLIYITVMPPWYRSWWAYTLYVLFFAGLLGSYLYYYRKQTDLKYQMKLAKEINENKISFFTNISHELRTPLTLIVNPIKELLVSNGQAIDLVDLSTVYRNSRRLLSLVDQLLLFKSSEKEISTLNATWVNISEICREVFLCFKNQVAEKNIHYTIDADGADLFIMGDREKLDIILFNLLSNAIKYTLPNGEVSLRISEQEHTVEIFVRDTGIGIPKETGDKLFKKFYRLEQKSVSESGFGIGLYLASQYVSIHNGKLTYKSELGQGTEFRIVLPKSNAQPANVKVTHEAHTKKTQSILDELVVQPADHAVQRYKTGKKAESIISSIETPKQTILLIEDDVDFRKYLKHLLQGHYEIYEADNAEVGFGIVADRDPDIVVSDVVLKGMSGIEFCAKMKKSPSFSHIPVIMLTGSYSPEIKLKGIECGADDYITKPFEKDLLIARINSILNGRNLLKRFFINEITLKQNQLKIPAEYSEFMSNCIAIIEKHLGDEDFTTTQFTLEIGMSRSKLFRNIKSISGLSIAEFIRYIRLRKAGQLMIETDMQIKEIAFKVGFNDQKHFREQFHKLFEMNPSEFVKKYKNSFSNNRTPSILGQIIKS